MEATKKTFIGKLNTDDSEMLLPPGDYTSANNIRIITPEGSETGRVTNVLGNRVLDEDFAPINVGDTITIGAYEDSTNRRLYWFNIVETAPATTVGEIHCYDADTDTRYLVCDDTYITGGLNFSPNQLIHSIALVDNVLYWTDNNNPPRRLNIGAAIKVGTGGTSPVESDFSYVLPLTQDDISIIRLPPAFCAWTEKKTDAGYNNNFIATESFQFAFQYQYYDGEMSVLSPWSRTVRMNRTRDSYNYITVTMPVDESVPQDARAVRLIAKHGLSGKSFVVRDWDKGTDADETAIIAHNVRSTLLSFDFYNDVVGEAIDDATSVKPFDSVPLVAKALEVAGNRLMLGNCTEGYDTPTELDMSIADQRIAVSGSLSQLLYELRVTSVAGAVTTYYSAYYLHLPHFDQDGWYLVPGTDATSTVGYPVLGAAPATGTFALLTFKGHNIQQVAENVKTGVGVVSEVTTTVTASSYNITAIPASYSGGSVYCGYHSKSAYQFGVVFYDKALRKCSVSTNSSLKVEVEDRDYGFTNITSSYEITLSNVAATGQIPGWAYYYQIVRTDNLKSRYWVQSYSAGTLNFYATKDSYGDYVFTQTTYTDSAVGVAINTAGLVRSGLGYQYQPGDICVIYTSGGLKYTIPVKDQAGDYVILNNEDVGTISGYNIIYEIYSPYISNSDVEPYFETGSMYSIDNPTTGSRQYSNTSIFLRGDMVYMQRRYVTIADYEVEAMSPNDKYYLQRMVDNGRVNIVSSLGQQAKKTSISYSNVYVHGSNTNGLSSFEALNETNLPTEMGEIQRLVMTSKSQSSGTVLLAVGKSETASIYLGESELFDANGSSFIAKSDGVLGSVQLLKGSYGTLHPESVVNYSGMVWFWDTMKASPITYNTNGLFPVAEYGMKGYYRNVSKDFIATFANTTDLGALDSRNIALGGVDPYNGEFLLYTPPFHKEVQGIVVSDIELESQPYTNILTGTDVILSDQITPGALYKVVLNFSVGAAPVLIKDGDKEIIEVFTAATDDTYYIRAYSDTWTITNAATVASVVITRILDTRHSIYDGQEATITYNPTHDRFVSRIQCHPDYFARLNNRLVSFRNGNAWIHDLDTELCTFFDIAYDCQIGFTHNEGGTVPKVYGAFVFEGTKPNYIHLRTEKPNVQSSSILEADFDDREGVYYAEVKRDRLSPNTSGSYETKEYRGDKMIGNVAKFSVIYTPATVEENLNNVTILYTPSRGHKI